MEQKSHYTPGRIGHVFFFPQKSYSTLKDKKKGWSAKTNGGLLELKRLELGGGDLQEDAEEAM